MCKSLKSKKILRCSDGYSLLEMAIVLVIFGLISVAALQVYVLYKKDAQIEQTNISLLRAKNAIGDFRKMYGRYPCPARVDAVRGDSDYGYEKIDPVTHDCQAVAGGVFVSTSNNSALSNRDVFIGILPFRQLNLPEKLVSDGYKNRLGYAVTGLLANDITYSDDLGGISIIDHNDNDAINPPDSAHFIVLSYNQDDAGAVTQNGIISNPCPAATPETENCDNDSTFRVGLKQTDFDDILEYTVSSDIQQWQLSNVDYNNIHLRRANSIAVGINETSNTSGFSEAEIKNSGALGMIRAEKTSATSSDGKFLSSNICDESGTECFPANLIGGQTPTGGMYCPSGEFLVGIDSGSPICNDEITFSCPNGDFVSGFNSNGELICSSQPPVRCDDSVLNTTCGDARNIIAFFDSGSWYGYAYSGQYYTIDPLDPAIIAAATTITDVENYISTLNDSARTSVDAGPTAATAMVRDTFKCSSGNWEISPIRKLERLNVTSDLSVFPPLYNTSSWSAETYGASYNPATPMSVDPDNTDWDHDCWCREDYRVVTESCGAGLSGLEFRIEKHICPQTGNSPWTIVYNTDSRFCACTPGTNTVLNSCRSYFGYSGIGIVGNVNTTYTTTCPGPVTTVSGVDISQCRCPAMPSPIYSTRSCPFGTTNNFTYLGNTYVGIEEIYRDDWVCPRGPAPTPASSAADAGSYVRTTVHTESCVCNSTLTRPYHENCLPDEQGTGRDYILPWNCTTRTFDDPSPANMVNEDCHKCIWQGGTLRSGIQSTAGAVERGTACSSCSDTSRSCYEVVGTSLYKVWDGCQCIGQ